MRIVINSEGCVVTTDDITKGIHRSNAYYCPRCHNQVIYVSESHRNCSYFRHLTLSTCELSNTSSDSATNKMSEFHTNWQSIFPPNSLEVRIQNHYADIYLSNSMFNIIDDDANKLFTLFEPNNLVIEIQNSKISYDTLVERQLTYKNYEDKRELLWIFNLEKSDCLIEHIKTYAEDKYRIKFLKGDSSFMKLLNIDVNVVHSRLLLKDLSSAFNQLSFKPHSEEPPGLTKVNDKSSVLSTWYSHAHILLDFGGSLLYYIRNNPSSDHDFIEASVINRNYFLRQISSMINFNVEWKYPLQQDNFSDYDYEHVYSLIKDQLLGKNIFDIRRCFFLMECIDFSHFLNHGYPHNYWSSQQGFLIVGEILSKLSSVNRHVMDIWIKWVMKNKPKYENRFPFGKHKGTKLCDIPASYLNWVIDNDINIKDDDLLIKVEILSYFNVYKLKHRFTSPEFNYSLGSLIKLYRIINHDDSWLPPPLF